MAIFKNKTGRGEVDYNKSPVQSADGTILFLNDHVGVEKGIFAEGLRAHTVFQLRGSSTGVEDVSDNKFSVTESSALTKRMENVNHNTRLKTFEFTAGKTLTLNPEIPLSILRDRTFRTSGLLQMGLRYNYQGGVGPGMDVGGSFSHILPYRLEYDAIDPGGEAGADEDGATDVIISFWIYAESYGANGSCIMETVNSNSRSLGIILTDNGQLTFRYYDWGATTGPTDAVDFQQITTTRKINLKTWYHITIFAKGYTNNSTGAYNNAKWNPNGLNEANPGHDAYNDQQQQVEIFINGGREEKYSEAGKTSGTFSGALNNNSANLPLVIGTGLGDYDSGSGGTFGNAANFEGRLAEISYFYTRSIQDALGTKSVPLTEAVLYRHNVALALFTSKSQPTSGITGVSERLLLRDLDQNSTHPTVERPGDQRRLGNHSIKFDDSRAQTLKGSTVQYPTKLVQGDKLLDTIYNGYFNGDLTLGHTASVESYDSFYRRNDQPAHEPFVESRIYIDDSSVFYQTGTLDSVIPGFSTPLRNKDSIHIKLSSTADLRLGLRSDSSTNGSVGSPNDFNNQDTMAYFNASTNLFDKLLPRTFPGTTNSNSDVFAARNLTGSCVAFAHQYQVLSASTTASLKVLTSDYDDFLDVNHPAEFAANLTLSKFPDSYYNASGRPISDFGFPDDNRYDASSSQVIKMSNYISEPFVVEKIVIKTPALEPSPRSNYGEGYNLKSAMNRDFFAFDIASQPLIVGGDKAGQTYPANTPGEALTVTAAITRGSFLFTPFLMRQTIGRQSGSLNLNYVVTDGPAGSVANGQQLPVTQSYSSEFTRDLITYGNAFFYTPENHRAAGVGLNSRDYLVRTAAFYAPFANDTRSAIMIMRLTSSINNTGIDFGGEGDRDATVRIIDSCYPHYEHRIPYGTDSYNSNFPTGSEGLVFELKPKLIFPLTCAGIVARTPSPIAETGTTGLCSHTLAWKGGARNISQISSARNFGPSQTGRKDPQTIELVTSFDDPESSGSENGITSVVVSATEGSEDSLYVLHPEDELIFGLHKNPNLESNNNQAQSIVVKAGDFDIALFGSYLRNSQPRQFQLNQLLSSDIVHESIGAEPIHDQFDVEPRNVFTGSYVDDIMSGSVDPSRLYSGFDSVNVLETSPAKNQPGLLNTIGSHFIEVGMNDVQHSNSSRANINGGTIVLRDVSNNAVTWTFDSSKTIAQSGPSNKIGISDITTTKDLIRAIVKAINDSSSSNNGRFFATGFPFRTDTGQKMTYVSAGFATAWDNLLRIQLLNTSGYDYYDEGYVLNSNVITIEDGPNTMYLEVVSLDWQPFSQAKFNLARRVNNRVSEGTQGVTGSLRRVVPHLSTTSTEFDSFLYDIKSMFAVDDRSDQALVATAVDQGMKSNYGTDVTPQQSPLLIGSAEKVDRMLVGSDPDAIGAYSITGDSDRNNKGVSANADIGASFLGSRYHTVRRVRAANAGTANFYNIIISGSTNADQQVPGLVSHANTDMSVSSNNRTAFSRKLGVEGMTDPRDLLLSDITPLFFGIGDGVSNAHELPVFTGDPPNTIELTGIIRGFRYGLSNIRDKKPKSIFRRDRYGQIRDMLEAAPNTAYIDDKTNTVSFPIEARFFDADGAVASPESTTCSNLSTNVTSSAPYFDRDVVEFSDPLVVRNRGPLINQMADMTIEF